MAIERLSWLPADTFGTLNERLRRFFSIADASARVDIQAASGAMTLVPTYPHTLYEVSTAAANAVLALPALKAVPGFLLEIKADGLAHTITVTPFGAETIDGGGAIGVTPAQANVTLVAAPAGWRVL